MDVLIPYFVSGGGFAGLIVLAFMFDWIYSRGYVRLLERQLAEKDRQLEIQQARADVAVTAAQAGRDALIAAIRGGAYAVEAVAAENRGPATAQPGHPGPP